MKYLYQLLPHLREYVLHKTCPRRVSWACVLFHKELCLEGPGVGISCPAVTVLKFFIIFERGGPTFSSRPESCKFHGQYRASHVRCSSKGCRCSGITHLGNCCPAYPCSWSFPPHPPAVETLEGTELHLTQRFPNLFEPHNFCFYFCWRLQSQWYSQGGLLVYFLEIEGIVLCILQKRPSSSPENVNSFTLSNFPRHRTAPKLFLNNNN